MEKEEKLDDSINDLKLNNEESSDTLDKIDDSNIENISKEIEESSNDTKAIQADGKKKKISWKEKRKEKLRKRYLNPVDIKYRGPLSYRYLRVIAWMAFAVGQMVMLSTIGYAILKWNSLGEYGKPIAQVFADLATPLFIVASFGLVLSGQKTHKSLIILYGALYFGLAIGLSILYSRYVEGLFTKIALSETSLEEIANNFIKSKIQINVFSDLFAFALFNLFINYTPKKVFVDKKIIIFRLFALIPIIYVTVSYILKVLYGLDKIDISVYGFLFMTTKSPFVFLIFIVASLWIKNRERRFLKIGATKEDYQNYLKTNRNSLSFSGHLSFIIIFFIILEVFAYVILIIYYMGIKELPFEEFDMIATTYGIGQTFPLVISIPFIMLYSYTRKHDDSKYDILVPIAGIALCAFAYVEGIYQILVRLLG